MTDCPVVIFAAEHVGPERASSTSVCHVCGEPHGGHRWEIRDGVPPGKAFAVDVEALSDLLRTP